MVAETRGGTTFCGVSHEKRRFKWWNTVLIRAAGVLCFWVTKTGAYGLVVQLVGGDVVIVSRLLYGVQPHRAVCFSVEVQA